MDRGTVIAPTLSERPGMGLKLHTSLPNKLISKNVYVRFTIRWINTMSCTDVCIIFVSGSLGFGRNA